MAVSFRLTYEIADCRLLSSMDGRVLSSVSSSVFDPDI